MKKYFIIGLLIFGCVNSVQAQDRLVFSIGTGLDLSTSIIAIQNPLLKEGNPVLSGNRLIPIKVGLDAFVFFATRKMSKTRPKTAKIINYTFGAFYAGLAISNARLINKYRIK